MNIPTFYLYRKRQSMQVRSYYHYKKKCDLLSQLTSVLAPESVGRSKNLVNPRSSYWWTKSGEDMSTFSVFHHTSVFYLGGSLAPSSLW